MNSTLLHDFYKTLSYQVAEEKLESEIEIDPTHRIFKGHFPGQPVVPGVCMMQIIKEAAERYAEYALILDKALDMKFLAVIDPSKNNMLKIAATFTREGEKLMVSASITHEDTVHFKFRGSFAKQ